MAEECSLRNSVRRQDAFAHDNVLGEAEVDQPAGAINSLINGAL